MYIVEKTRILKTRPDDLGWRQLTVDRIEPYAGEPPQGIARKITNLVHISDTHICDAQSTARVEYLDRFADQHNPISQVIQTLVGTYRAHETLSTQVLESMIQRINRIKRTPITLGDVDAVVMTGDLTDNAQVNELDWFMRIMTGQKIRPDSGGNTRFEGFGGSIYSEHHWNPQGTPKGERDDAPRSLYGFPIVMDLMDAVRAPFFASGLNRDWFAVHGNHDALLQGTVKPDDLLRAIAVGDQKAIELPEEEVLRTLKSISEIGPASYPDSKRAKFVRVTSDKGRDFLSPQLFAQAFSADGNGHGYNNQMAQRGIRYWSRQIGGALLVVLDTVNPNGGWQGSLDLEQFEWLANCLVEHRNENVIIASHHPIQDLLNGYSPDGAQRVLATELLAELSNFSNVILWLAGHTHRNRITYYGSKESSGFWQIETSSLIDWPQQGRIVEVFEDTNGDLFIGTTMIDHAGSLGIDPTHIRLDDVHNLAGLSRLLSVNDWQRRGGLFSIEANEGGARDRNAFLRIPRRSKATQRAASA